MFCFSNTSSISSQIFQMLTSDHYCNKMRNAYLLCGESALTLRAGLESKGILKNLGYKLLHQIEFNRIDQLMAAIQTLIQKNKTPREWGFVFLRAANTTGSNLTSSAAQLPLPHINPTCILIECSMSLPNDFFNLARNIGCEVKAITISFDSKKIYLEWLSNQLRSIGLVPRACLPNETPRSFWNNCGGSLPGIAFELIKLSAMGLKHRLSSQRVHKLLQPLPFFAINTLRKALLEQNIMVLLLVFKDLKYQHHHKTFFRAVSDIFLLLKTILEPQINFSGDLFYAEALEGVYTLVMLINSEQIAECDESFVWSLLLCANIIVLLRAQDLLSDSNNNVHII